MRIIIIISAAARWHAQPCPTPTASKRRAAVFAALFGVLSRQATAALKREGNIMVRLARDFAGKPVPTFPDRA